MSDSEVRTGYAAINGAQMYYETAGDGTPVVFIHAGIADRRMWDDQFPFFAKQFRVVRYDQRGFGQTVPVPGSYSAVADLAGLLEALGIESAYLVGCSMGGILAMDFALAHPDRILGLVMVGASPSGFEYDAPDPPPWAEVQAAWDAGDLERVCELEMRIWFDGAGRAPDQVDGAIRQKAFDMNLIALRHEKSGIGGKREPPESKAVDRLDAIHVPLLIVVGDRDSIVLIKAAEHMAQHVAGAQEILLHETAHLPSMEKPDEFNHHLMQFLAGAE